VFGHISPIVSSVSALVTLAFRIRFDARERRKYAAKMQHAHQKAARLIKNRSAALDPLAGYIQGSDKALADLPVVDENVH
jgi:hypothetical protein